MGISSHPPYLLPPPLQSGRVFILKTESCVAEEGAGKRNEERHAAGSHHAFDKTGTSVTLIFEGVTINYSLLSIAKARPSATNSSPEKKL